MHKKFQKMMFVSVLLVQIFFHQATFAKGNAEFQAQISNLENTKPFELTISIDPKNSSIDLVRVEMKFDPAFISFEQPQLKGEWNHQTPGNYLDNTKGNVSWGGFSTKGGISKSQPFLKFVAIANKEGKTEIQILKTSKLLSDGNSVFIEKDQQIKVEIAPAKENTENAILTLQSKTHPDQKNWYKEKNVEFKWIELQSSNPVTEFYTAFDESVSTNPTTASEDENVDGASLTNVSDGLHYFHLKGKRKDGSFTNTIHYSVRIDTQRPNPIALTIASDKIKIGESAFLTFATTDDLSGVSEYKIAMNDGEFKTSQSPAEIKDLEKGTYFFRVAAIDRAGNVIYQGKSLRVYATDEELNRPENYKQNDEMVGKDREAGKDGEEKYFLSLSKNQIKKLLITLSVIIFGSVIMFVFKKLLKKNKV